MIASYMVAMQAVIMQRRLLALMNHCVLRVFQNLGYSFLSICGVLFRHIEETGS